MFFITPIKSRPTLNYMLAITWRPAALSANELNGGKMLASVRLVSKQVEVEAVGGGWRHAVTDGEHLAMLKELPPLSGPKTDLTSTSADVQT